MRREIQEIEQQVIQCSERIDLIKQREGQLEDALHRFHSQEGELLRQYENEIITRDRIIADLKGDISNLKQIIAFHQAQQ